MISSVIQEARQCQGLTLGALANKVGINKSTLSRWETGKTRPCAPELARVLEILDIPETMCRQCFQQVGTPRTDRYLVRDAAEQARLPVSGGELLRALRVRASYSQADAARRVAVTQQRDVGQDHDRIRQSCTFGGRPVSAGEACSLG